MKKMRYAKGLLKKAKENGVFVGAVASSGSTDRDGEILQSDGWVLDNFKKAPRLLWGHNPHELPIGKVTDIKIDKNRLVFDAELAEKENDFAAKVGNLMRGGFLNTFSVGFRPLERDGDTFKRMELLEISVVNVPANAEAMLSHEFKQLQKEEKKMIKKNKDQKLVEEDDKRIRIKIDTCKVTATITISKKQGISALYCGKEKKIRTYIFLKSKGWDVPKAKKWVEDHKNKLLVINTIKRALLESDKIVLRNTIATCKEALKVAETRQASIKKGGLKVGSRRANKSNKNQNDLLQALRIIDRATESAIHKLKDNYHG